MDAIRVYAQSVEVLTDSVYRIILQSDDAIPEFLAGQYLQLEHDDIGAAFFTIASAPQMGLELHIEINAEGGTAEKIIRLFQDGQTLSATLPMGDTHVQCIQPDRPVMLVCSGSGFSQVKAVAEHLMQHSEQPIYIYWAARKSSGLYMLNLAEQWAESHDRVHFTAVIHEKLEWNGNHSQLDQIIIDDFKSLENFEILCCGSPAMVYHTLDTLMVANAQQAHFYSDVFAYAPRTK